MTENLETVYGPETRAEWIARQLAGRLVLRELMWAEAVRDPHWLNRANRHLESALEENATRYGLNAYATGSAYVPEQQETLQELNLGVYHTAAEEVPVERRSSGAELGGVAI